MRELSPVTVPIVQIRPNMILVYPQTLWPSGFAPNRRSNNLSIVWNKQENQDANFEGKEAYSGQLTFASRKRLQKAINLLVAISDVKRVQAPKSGKWFDFKVNFVTLTLPSAQGSITDKELKKTCLDNFFKAMRRKHQLKDYVWRAERQFNGNLHFHITTNTYLPQDAIRNEWNRQLSKFHFIDDFKALHGHSNPNSTDVHAVSKLKNIAAYMVKYMSKDPAEHLEEVNQKRMAKGDDPIIPEDHEFRQVEGQPLWDDPINGKVWDCSLNLKSKTRCETEACDQIQAEVNRIVKKHHLKWKSTEYCYLIFTGNKDMKLILEGELLQMYLSYLSDIKDQRSHYSIAA